MPSIKERQISLVSEATREDMTQTSKSINISTRRRPLVCRCFRTRDLSLDEIETNTRYILTIKTLLTDCLRLPGDSKLKMRHNKENYDAALLGWYGSQCRRDMDKSKGDMIHKSKGPPGMRERRDNFRTQRIPNPKSKRQRVFKPRKN